MPFEVERLRTLAKDDFEDAWLEGARILKGCGAEEGIGLKALGMKGPGKEHPVMAAIQQAREVFLKLGFEEMVNPVIVDEGDVFSQYGPEASVILDRCFYLAGLPRPDIGLPDTTVARLKELVPGFDDVTGLQTLLRDYKKGLVEGDDFVEEMVSRLGLRSEDATRIIDTLFPSFRELAPIPSRQTLRSHMTTPWFLTLAELSKKRPPPLKLFTTGLRFRREQREDATHLRAHYGASCAIMAEGIGMKDGELLARQVLKPFGFKKLRFDVKAATSKYYAPDMEVEVFGFSREAGWVEIADLGMYSPVALAHYGIEYPVLNIGFGIERIVMLATGATDVRALMYPQFHSELSFTDEELAGMVSLNELPATDGGKALAEAVAAAARDHADDPGPVTVEAWKGELAGLPVEVSLIETEEGARLLGPAARNRLVVRDGSVRAVPEGDDTADAVETGITVLDAVTALAAVRAERDLKDEGEVMVQVRMAKSASDVNVTIDPLAREFIRGKKRRIDVRGPVFVCVQVRRTDKEV